ncbi:ATP-binding protein [Campylobacterota bacterium]
MSLKTRFILTFGFGTVLFMFLITILVFNRMESAMEKQLFQQFNNDGLNSLAWFSEEIHDLDIHFTSSTSLPMFNSMRFHQLTLNKAGHKNDIRQLELYFYGLIQKNTEISEIVFVDKQALEVFRINRQGISSDLHDMSLNRQIIGLLQLQKGEIRTTYKIKDSKITDVVWWVPVYVSSNTQYGVMGFSVGFQFFKDRVMALASSAAESVCLSDSSEQVLISSDDSKKCFDASEQLWKVDKEIDLHGQVWKIALYIDSLGLLEEVSSLKKLIFFFIFPLVAGLAFIFTLIFSNHILKAIEKLVIAAKTIGKGDLLSVVPFKRDDELGELAKEMKRSAELIQKNKSKLEEKNRDLEAYSYTLAHDLRTPLRSISSFAQILEMDAQEKLNEEEKSFIQRIVQASKRMSALIDDILELSRISNRDITLNKVCLSDLAKTIIVQFKETFEERNVNTIIEEGLYAVADGQLLQLVLENLLGNAWKYTGKNEYTEIEFGSLKVDDETVYFIRDNGVGFDMKYVNKLFSPFQRLHSFEEFEGTGIGLASVKRIIERHLGRIWIESKVDVGTTVYFTLENSFELKKGNNK